MCVCICVSVSISLSCSVSMALTSLFRKLEMFKASALLHLATHLLAWLSGRLQMHLLWLRRVHSLLLYHLSLFAVTSRFLAIFSNGGILPWLRHSPGESLDWCCLYYFVRNSLVALLEALCAQDGLRLVPSGTRVPSLLTGPRQDRNLQGRRHRLRWAETSTWGQGCPHKWHWHNQTGTAVWASEPSADTAAGPEADWEMTLAALGIDIKLGSILTLRIGSLQTFPVNISITSAAGFWSSWVKLFNAAFLWWWWLLLLL